MDVERLGELTSRQRERAAGRLFGRWARSVALARTSGKDIAQIAREHRWVEADLFEKTAVAANTTEGSFAYALRQSLAELEANFSAVRRLQPGFRSVAPLTAIVATSSGATAAWCGEGAPAPMSRQSVGTRSTLQPMRLAAMSAVTEELAQLSDSEAIISTDHARARSNALDAAFFDPENAGSPEVLPKSITHDCRQFPSTGNSVSAIDADLRLMINEMSAGGSNLTSVVWVANPTAGGYIGSLRGSGGSPAYPDVGVLGGSLLGLPLITTQGIGLSGSPNESYLVLVDPSRIWWTEGAPSFSTSRTAAIEMSDAPTNDSSTGTGANLVSMWQTHSMAILSTSRVNWQTVDDTSAAVVLVRCNF